MSYNNLKKNSSATIQKLIEAAEKLNSSKANYNTDADEYWQPTIDKAGNGYAVIRFLPAKEGEDCPWVQYWDHGFQGPTGRWYIEKSLTSLGESDPVSDHNSILWNSGNEDDKETVRKRKRRLHYVSNIEVISDSANPESEGKTFKFKYGKKIFDKIMDVMQPQFEDEEPINPFDFWGGANFKLKIRKVEGYRNYDKSEFEAPSQHRGGDDKQLEEVYNNLYSLAEILDRKNFKSYAELKAKFYQVIGEEEAVGSMTTSERISIDDTADSDIDSVPSFNVDDDSDDNSDDTLSHFARLARGE